MAPCFFRTSRQKNMAAALVRLQFSHILRRLNVASGLLFCLCYGTYIINTGVDLYTDTNSNTVNSGKKGYCFNISKLQRRRVYRCKSERAGKTERLKLCCISCLRFWLNQNEKKNDKQLVLIKPTQNFLANEIFDGTFKQARFKKEKKKDYP